MTEDNQPRRDRQLVRFVTETPWAILPSALATIRNIVARHQAGDRLTPDQLEAAIGPARAKTPAPKSGAVAVIPLRGPIVPHADAMTEISGGASVDGFLTAFRAALADKEVSHIVLDIDSPGGAVDLIPEAAAEIRAGRNRKPVTAIANTDAASAAYWLASQASELVVTPSGKVGSIGVFAAHDDISAAQEKMGVKTTLISAGDHKTEESPFEPLIDEARDAIQARVDGYYRMFVADVAKGRGIDVGAVEASYGQGRMLLAADALRAGMVDRVATVEDTIRSALGTEPGRVRARASGFPAEVDAMIDAGGNLTIESVEYDETKRFADAIVEASYPEFSVAQERLALTGTTSAASLSLNPTAAATTSPTAAAGTAHFTTTNPPLPAAREQHPKPKKESNAMHNINELLARQQEIEARKAELDNEYAGQAFSPEAQDEFDLIDAEWDGIEAAKKNIADRAGRLSKIAVTGGGFKADAGGATSANVTKPQWEGRSNVTTTNNLPDNPHDLAAYRNHATSMDSLNGLYKEGARRISAHLSFENSDDEAATKQHIDRLLARDTPDAEFARRVIHCGSPLYDKAFGKQVLGHNLTTQEQATLSEAGITSATLPVPITIDPTVIVTNNGVRNPLRAMARNVSITGMTWTGISSDGVTASYDAELAEVSDDSPTFAAPTATVAAARAFVPFSIELDQDWGNLRTELTRMFVDSKDTLEATKFLTGSGTNEPLGLQTALTTGSGTASILLTAGTATLALADLTTVSNALPPRFDANAEWLASKAIYAAFNVLSSTRTDFWVTISNEAGSSSQQLLGYPVNQLSTMDTVYTTGKYVAILGDFSQFVIIDRVGMNVELIPHLFHTSNNRPYGARGLWAMWRNTSQITTYKAFRILKTL